MSDTEHTTTVSTVWLNQIRNELLTVADRCDTQRAQLAELVTLGFNMVGSSGAKRKQHTASLTDRLHELQAELSGRRQE